MIGGENYYIVEASVLPDVFQKVMEVKHYLKTGEERTIHSATQRVGISRSAYYKYKDAVRPFRDMGRGRFVTIQMLLRDKPGALSDVLNLLAVQGVNILTINQSIPNGGIAAVTVSMEIADKESNFDNLLSALKSARTVIRCEVLAG